MAIEGFKLLKFKKFFIVKGYKCTDLLWQKYNNIDNSLQMKISDFY